MSAITLEKTYALLEKLAEYVMNEVPTRKEMEAKLAHLESRLDAKLVSMEARLDQIADKQDVKRLEDKVNKFIEGMDAMVGELADQRT
jgi:hypothetical protein